MDDLMPELEPHAFGKKNRQMSKMSKKISQSTSKAH